MIEINAKLTRKDTASYVTGEKVECFVEINNIENTTKSGKNLNQDEHLAWGSIQIQCYSSTNSAAKAEDETEYQNTTALGNSNSSANIIVSTKAKILFCDLKLKFGESKTYFYSEFIPRAAPPTYSGFNINYFYKIVIATQRVKSKVKTLSVPIRVLPVPVIAKREEYTSSGTQENLKPTNPFLDKSGITELELSWNHLSNLTARRMPKFYKITNKKGYIGRFCIFKNDYKLGEDIVGTIDFTDYQVRCVQFSVKLQREEIVKSDKEKLNSDNSNGRKLTTYTNHHEFCLSMIQTQIIIPIPLTVTPSFTTDNVDVRWRLHFEFVTNDSVDDNQKSDDGGNWVAPKNIQIETMIWDLPINIWSTSPLQIWTPSKKHIVAFK